MLREHQPVEPHLCRLSLIIELLPEAFGKFLINFVLVNRVVHSMINSHRKTQLPQIRFNRTGHVRILQLARDFAPIGQRRPVHLP
jgi:hypothetical protein